MKNIYDNPPLVANGKLRSGVQVLSRNQRCLFLNFFHARNIELGLNFVGSPAELYMTE